MFDSGRRHGRVQPVDRSLGAADLRDRLPHPRARGRTRATYQEAYLRAFRSIGDVKGQARFSSWLYRIARSLCREWLRKERAVRVGPAPDDLQAEQARALET